MVVSFIDPCGLTVSRNLTGNRVTRNAWNGENGIGILDKKLRHVLRECHCCVL